VGEVIASLRPGQSVSPEMPLIDRHGRVWVRSRSEVDFPTYDVIDAGGQVREGVQAPATLRESRLYPSSRSVDPLASSEIV